MNDRERRPEGGASSLQRAGSHRANNSQAKSDSGARIAVSFASAPSENHSTAFHGRSSREASSPQNVNPAEARSRCARELCVKKTGYNATKAVVAHATGRLAAKRANRKSPSREKAATRRVAVRVTNGEYPATRQASASQANTSGGCAFEGVKCGMSVPLRYKSRAAGM